MNDFSLNAKAALLKHDGVNEDLIPLYIQPDRQVFLAKNSNIVLKVYEDGKTLEKEYQIAQQAATIGVPIADLISLESGTPTVLIMKYIDGSPITSKNIEASREAGRYLQSFHNLGAQPPFSGGHSKWDEFILWWALKEIDNVKNLNIFTEHQLQQLTEMFNDLKPLLVSRPTVLLHGDLQSEHILVSKTEDKVLAFLDFADAQPGDPLLDIAVLTLNDEQLADLVLEGYGSNENSNETKTLLAHYRLLRRLAEIPWLHNRGLNDKVNLNILTIQNILS